MGAPSSREAHLSGKLPGRADLALGAPARGIHQVSGTKLYLIRPPGSKSNIHSKSELRERLFWPGWMSSRAWPRAAGNTLCSSPPSLLAHTDHPTFSVPAREHCIRKLMLLSSWLEATKKSLRCCQLLYCHLIPQFRDVLCSLEHSLLESHREQQGKDPGCERPWDRHSRGCAATDTLGNASSG